MPVKKLVSIAVAVALVAAAVVLAQMYVAAQVYYPVVRLASADGLFVTAMHDQTSERRQCGEMNQRFVAPIRAYCKDCRVVYARCERQLEGEQEALYAGRSQLDLVLSPGLRMAISGPGRTARELCDFVAADLVKRGYRSAICIHPKASGTGK